MPLFAQNPFDQDVGKCDPSVSRLIGVSAAKGPLAG